MNTRIGLSVLFPLIFLAAPLAAQTATPAPTAIPASPAGRRLTLPLESNWLFHRTDQPGADLASWSTVNLPYDWAIAGPFSADAPSKRGGAYLPTGVGQFRKIFTLPADDAGRRVEIQFDGIMSNGEVFINGHSLGLRPYGYVGVNYDLTPFLTFGADKPTVVDVNVNNSYQPLSRYYTGSGIERHVRIVVTNPVHVETWGIYVTTPLVTPEKATVHLQTTVTNNSTSTGHFFLEAMVHGSDGKMIGPTVASAPQEIAAGKSVIFEQDLTVPNPKLWDLASPTLYKAMVAVINNDAPKPSASAMTDPRAVDVDSTNSGIRKIEFKSDNRLLAE